jgi:adenine deaminase
MNFPAVVHAEGEVMNKIAAAHRAGKPIDGHAPGLSGDQLSRYAKTGITTDHECGDINEALEKISLGMRILIREGSAARNFDSLAPLIATHGEMCMFCSDDKHPDDLVKGHMNDLVKRAISKGIDIMSVLRCATLNPILHYKLNVGLLQENDPADFIITNDLHQMNILKTYSYRTVLRRHPTISKPGQKPLRTSKFVIPAGKCVLSRRLRDKS